MTIESPLWLDPNPTTGDAPTYSARQDRGIIGALFTEGVENLQGGDLLVTQHTAGVAMSVDVAVGVGYVKGDDIPRQGTYRVVVSATETVAIPAAPATGSRIDLIVLAMHDITAAGGTRHGAFVDVVSGTPAASPAAPAAPASALVLAQVIVAAGTSAITNAMITDRRVAVAPGAAMGIGAQPMTTAQRGAISSPAIGQLIYNTTVGGPQIYGPSGWQFFLPDEVLVSTSFAYTATSVAATLTYTVPLGTTFRSARVSFASSGFTGGILDVGTSAAMATGIGKMGGSPGTMTLGSTFQVCGWNNGSSEVLTGCYLSGTNLIVQTNRAYAGASYPVPAGTQALTVIGRP